MIEKDVAMVLQEKLRQVALDEMQEAEHLSELPPDKAVNIAYIWQGIMDMLYDALRIIEEETK